MFWAMQLTHRGMQLLTRKGCVARTRGRVQGLHLVLSGLFSKYLNVGVVEVVLVILIKDYHE